jgi:hypothetical protein
MLVKLFNECVCKMGLIPNTRGCCALWSIQHMPCDLTIMSHQPARAFPYTVFQRDWHLTTKQTQAVTSPTGTDRSYLGEHCLQNKGSATCASSARTPSGRFHEGKGPLKSQRSRQGQQLRPPRPAGSTPKGAQKADGVRSGLGAGKW